MAATDQKPEADGLEDSAFIAAYGEIETQIPEEQERNGVTMTMKLENFADRMDLANTWYPTEKIDSIEQSTLEDINKIMVLVANREVTFMKYGHNNMYFDANLPRYSLDSYYELKDPVRRRLGVVSVVGFRKVSTGLPLSKHYRMTLNSIVIELIQDDDDKAKILVRPIDPKVSLSKYQFFAIEHRASVSETINRSISKFHKTEYELLKNNCQIFIDYVISTLTGGNIRVHTQDSFWNFLLNPWSSFNHEESVYTKK